jgi:hypothetical protein
MPQKIITLIKILFQRFQILCQLFKLKSYGDDVKFVVFDIKKPSYFYRHLVNPTVFFIMNNYNVCFRFRYHFTKQLGKYYKLVSKKRQVKLIFSRPKHVTYYFTNDPQNTHTVLIKPDKFGLEEYESESFRVPPPMHPNVYQKDTFEHVERIRKEKNIPKKYRIVFAGNLNKNLYKDFQWGQELYENRVKLINLLQEEFKDKVFMPRTYQEYKQNNQAQICIIDRSNFSLNLKEYFSFFQSGYFSFCPPGMVQPFCHNLVESMHNDCIPILQYNHLLSPVLKDNKECISYDSQEKLIKKINLALEMEEEYINTMTQNVTNYYNANLHPNAVIKNIENTVQKGSNILYLPAGT